MALSSHVEQLKQKHTELDQLLQEALRHPSTHDNEIVELKRQKLVIKDKLTELVH